VHTRKRYNRSSFSYDKKPQSNSFKKVGIFTILVRRASIVLPDQEESHPIDPFKTMWYYVLWEVRKMENTFMIHDEFKEIDTRTIDERNRLTLGELMRGYKRVRLYKNERGEVLLQPVVEIPASELWLYQNRDAMESVLKGIKDASEAKISRLDLGEL
jgi:hypothetical protein